MSDKEIIEELKRSGVRISNCGPGFGPEIHYVSSETLVGEHEGMDSYWSQLCERINEFLFGSRLYRFVVTTSHTRFQTDSFKEMASWLLPETKKFRVNEYTFCIQRAHKFLPKSQFVARWFDGVCWTPSCDYGDIQRKQILPEPMVEDVFFGAFPPSILSDWILDTIEGK